MLVATCLFNTAGQAYPIVKKGEYIGKNQEICYK